MTDPDEARTGGEPEERRSLVDLTISPDEMLRVRDTLRAGLLDRYYTLLMRARLEQKRGRATAGRRLEAAAREIAIMIWCLDNPMESLTWPRGDPKG